MDVSVLSKRGQRWSRLAGARQSVFGDGLLERARATTLGLLGLVAAVGLAIVALGLNQSWPLIPGSSIPSIPPRHQAVGEATIAAAAAHAVPATKTSSGGGASSAAAAHAGQQSGGSGHAEGPVPGGSTELVVSPSTPAKLDGGGGHGDSGQASPPAVATPKPTSTAKPTPATSPAPTSVPVSSPSPPPDAAPPRAPAATSSELPEEPSTPSPGSGHAYGHSDDRGDHGHDWGDDDDWDGGDHDWGDDDHGWDGGDHGWSGHGHYGSR